jgi:hypothetical protein
MAIEGLKEIAAEETCNLRFSIISYLFSSG